LKNRKLAQDWIAFCVQEDYRLLKSAINGSPQAPSFVEHRWEQSVLSLLVKARNYPIIPDETFFAPNWSQGFSFPIWAMRNRSGGDAVRRNLLDLLLIGFGRLEMIILKEIQIYRKFLNRIMGLAK
jgi:hypothetical protein